MRMPLRTPPGRRTLVVLLFAAGLGVGLVGGCGSSVGVAGPVPTPLPSPVASAAPGTPGSPGPTALPSGPAASPASSPSPAPTTSVRVYLFAPDAAGGDAHLVPVLRTIPATRAIATAAVRELLGGPGGDEPGLLTMIPAGSRLLGITIDGRTATVDLTGAFESGGGSASMLGRLAQLVYTVTQFPTVDTVRLRLDGQPVDSIGGEGVMVGAGLGRADAVASLPAIFVDRPAWGGALPSTSRVSGVANVFEAQFQLQVLDAAGHILADMPVQAACGTGCWGAFDVGVTYAVATSQRGTLRVFDLSAKDGTPADVRDYPVWLTAAGS